LNADFIEYWLYRSPTEPQRRHVPLARPSRKKTHTNTTKLPEATGELSN